MCYNKYMLHSPFSFFGIILLLSACTDGGKSQSDWSQDNIGDGTVTDTDNANEQDRDLDGDGYLSSEECDDGNTLINPSMPKFAMVSTTTAMGRSMKVSPLDTSKIRTKMDLGTTTKSKSLQSTSGYVTIGSDCDDDNPIFSQVLQKPAMKSMMTVMER